MHFLRRRVHRTVRGGAQLLSAGTVVGSRGSQRVKSFSGAQRRLLMGMLGEASSRRRGAEAGKSGIRLFAGDGSQRTTIATGNRTNGGTGEAGRSSRGFPVDLILRVGGIGDITGPGHSRGEGGGRSGGCRSNGGSGGSGPRRRR